MMRGRKTSSDLGEYRSCGQECPHHLTVRSAPKESGRLAPDLSSRMTRQVVLRTNAAEVPPYPVRLPPAFVVSCVHSLAVLCSGMILKHNVLGRWGRAFIDKRKKVCQTGWDRLVRWSCESPIEQRRLPEIGMTPLRRKFGLSRRGLGQLFGSTVVLEGSLNEATEDRVRIVGLAAEFGVELAGDEEGVVRQFDGLGQLAFLRDAADDEAIGLELVFELVIDLITMAMTLVDGGFLVEFVHLGALGQFGDPVAETHGAAELLHLFLLLHHADDGSGGAFIKLGAVGVFQAADIAGKLDDGDLHAEADAKEGNAGAAGITCGGDFALGATVAEAPGDEDALQAAEVDVGAAFLDGLGVHTHDVHFAVIGCASVGECLVDALVGVLEFDVFAHNTDAHVVGGVNDALDEVAPLAEIGLLRGEVELLAHNVVKTLFVQFQRHLIDAVFDVADLDDVLDGHVAKEGDLFTHVLIQWMLSAAEDDVGGDPDLTQLGDGLLGGFGLQFLSGLDVWHEGGVDEEHIALAHLMTELTDGLQEGQAFDVTDGAADLGDDDVGGHLGGNFLDAVFDLVGDVRDDLHGAALVFTSTFFSQHALVNLTAGKVVQAGEIGVGEALVVAEVEVGLSAVIEHIHFTMFVRVHGARIDVQIRVKLLHDHLQPPQLQQGAERRSGQTLAQGADDASGDKDVLHGLVLLGGRHGRSGGGLGKELLFDGGGLLGGIHAGREVVREHDAQGNAVFHGTQLLKGLRLLQPGGRPSHELKEEAPLEAVDAQMAVVTHTGRGIAHVGQGRAGEIQRVAFHIKDHLHHIRVGDLGGIVDRRGSGDHAHLGLAPQDNGEFVNEGWGDERFIALDIDDGAVIGKRTSGLSDAIRATGVIGRGQDGTRAKGGCGFGDALVIGGDDDVVHFTTILATLPDMLNQRLSRDEMKRFAREACRSPPSGDRDESALVFGIGQGW